MRIRGELRNKVLNRLGCSIKNLTNNYKMSHSVNPYELLGVTIDSTTREVRKAYYKLSLLCHPDKGGSGEDMTCLHTAYIYVMEQIGFSEGKQKLEDIEKDFKEYFEKNKIEVPPFYEIWERSEEAEFLREFNKEFEQRQHVDLEERASTIFGTRTGYGKMMDKSSIDRSEYSIDDIADCREQETIFDSKNKFTGEIVIYEEPTTLPNSYGEYERFDISELDDYSQQTNGLGMFDYKIAHTEFPNLDNGSEKGCKKSYDELVKEREEFNDNLMKMRDTMKFTSKIHIDIN